MLTRHSQKNLTWIDLVSPSPAEVRELMKEFDLHPLMAQELLVPTYRSKVERQGDEALAILHFPTLRGVAERADHEIDFIIGKGFLITTRYENIDPLHIFGRVFEVEAVLGRSSATHGGHLFASMVRSLYQALGDEGEALSRRLKEIEDRIFKGDERRMVIELSQTGRVIHDFRQALLPHREMLSSLGPALERLFGHEFSYYIRDIEGACARVERAFLHLRESLEELRETNNSLLSTKQNEVMKTLTVVAFIFLPLTFITQIFGMSTPYLPLINEPGGFLLVLGGLAFIAAGCLLYFKRKGWL